MILPLLAPQYLLPESLPLNVLDSVERLLPRQQLCPISSSESLNVLDSVDRLLPQRHLLLKWTSKPFTKGTTCLSTPLSSSPQLHISGRGMLRILDTICVLDLQNGSTRNPMHMNPKTICRAIKKPSNNLTDLLLPLSGGGHSTFAFGAARKAAPLCAAIAYNVLRVYEPARRARRLRFFFQQAE